MYLLTKRKIMEVFLSGEVATLMAATTPAKALASCSDEIREGENFRGKIL